MSISASSTGRSPGKTIFFLLVAGTIYSGFQLAPPYIRDYQIANVFDDEARRAHLMGDEEIRRNIVGKLQDIGAGDHLGSDDIVIKRDEAVRRIQVYAEYDVEVELVPGKAVTLHFTPEVDRPIRRQ
jgi:hypothetical protein